MNSIISGYSRFIAILIYIRRGIPGEIPMVGTFYKQPSHIKKQLNQQPEHNKKCQEKMAVAFWYLIILIVSQLSTCSGACSVLYDNPLREEIAKCRKLLKVLKDAIVSDEDNMFILRDAFTSASHPFPSLMVVTYKVYPIKHHTDLFPNFLQVIPKEGFNITYLWSNSQIFTIINPQIIFMFQPAILTLAYVIGEDLVNYPRISLNLYITEDSLAPLKPNVSDLLYSFSTITEQVRYTYIICHTCTCTHTKHLYT